jgi:hypothetical protein
MPVSSLTFAYVLNPLIVLYQLGMLAIVNISLKALPQLHPFLGYRFVPIG